MKVVTINKHGVIVWERDLMGQHTIHLRNYNNQIHYKADISYFVKEKLKPNDIIACNDSTLILDLTNKHGTGVLDVIVIDNTRIQPTHRVTHLIKKKKYFRIKS